MSCSNLKGAVLQIKVELVRASLAGRDGAEERVLYDAIGVIGAECEPFTGHVHTPSIEADLSDC
jgi:hypothetical protein